MFVLGVENEFVLGLFPVELMNPEGGPDGDETVDCGERIVKIEGSKPSKEESKGTAAHNARTFSRGDTDRKDSS